MRTAPPAARQDRNSLSGTDCDRLSQRRRRQRSAARRRRAAPRNDGIARPGEIVRDVHGACATAPSGRCRVDRRRIPPNVSATHSTARPTSSAPAGHGCCGASRYVHRGDADAAVRRRPVTDVVVVGSARGGFLSPLTNPPPCTKMTTGRFTVRVSWSKRHPMHYLSFGPHARSR